MIKIKIIMFFYNDFIVERYVVLYLWAGNKKCG